jgi:hypothetical protein
MRHMTSASSSAASPLHQLVPGIHLWRASHPEWRTHDERVACYALDFHDEGVVLVDPLLSGDEAGPVVDALRALAGDRRVHVYVTIPYHVRSAEHALEVFGTRRSRIYGHPALEDRLDDPSRFVDATAAGALPFHMRALHIGNPVRNELPLHSTKHRAIVFGDAVIGVRRGLRLWQELEGHEEWYHGRFLPSLRYLVDLPVDHVLVTHGEPVLHRGQSALRSMLRTKPVPSIRGELSGDAVAARSSSN